VKFELDEKRRVVRIVPEREEDLYFIYLLIDRGDIVRGWTVREYKPEGAKEGERVKMYLGISVEKIEYHKFRSSLRVRGTVVEVQEEVEGVKGRRHTFEIVPGREVVVEKRRGSVEVVKRILDMANVALPRILLVSIDDEEAALAYISALGAEIMYTVPNQVNRGKRGESLLEDFFKSVNTLVEEVKRLRKIDRVVLAGPGMVVDQAGRYIRGERVVQSSGGVAGVYEFLRSGLYDKLKEELGLEAYSRLQKMLASQRDLVALGVEEVKEAVSIGRAETVLILDTYMKEKPDEAWEILSQVYNTGGKVYIVREDTEVGAAIRAMGNIVALLRW